MAALVKDGSLGQLRFFNKEASGQTPLIKIPIISLQNSLKVTQLVKESEKEERLLTH